MSEPLRTDPSNATDAASERDRDAKIEQLLLAGLDHYFTAEFDQAINVWTRVLFLDRNHARARAYIERARSAVAERQRESEELLQTGLAAFHRGEGGEARRLLQDAISKGAPSDEALAVLDRMSRLEQSPATTRPPAATRVDRLPLPTVHARGGKRVWGVVVSLLVIAVVAIGGVAVATETFDWRALVSFQPPSSPAPSTSLPLEASLPLPLKAETAFERARGLQAGGRLRDALATLDLIRPTDAQKADADRLRADIQKQLLGMASADGGSPPASRKGDGPLP
jgi:tetratricopeptide (TPR) repeat protein